MLNNPNQSTMTGAAKKNILVDTKNRFAVSCKIASTGVEADAHGKKIVKAGTPLAGSLTARETAFTVAKASTDDIVGILQDDVDVTSGESNGSCLVFGFVDESKLEASVVTAITTVTKAKLPLITFIK